MFFFFNDTATTEIYTLSLHDALPIYRNRDGPTPTNQPGRQHQRDMNTSLMRRAAVPVLAALTAAAFLGTTATAHARSEEHTSELQSRQYLVCRLLLEKKKATVGRIER